ncbi:D-cysteine desulfhydrase family protein [Alkaliphilus peptidifermentans]|uniref:D-cysteine desulfhydrase n=1 Tax=Alkaliphilus peptidifermentans DSM 18978 TaxID=1120976 RepID=A0A1G5L7K8_9FIRM|nr:D-cysteine desulfhydrase family protein [Alkaliphilus peptidifermentans]SCZ08260.1 D-cysteine desulfhydrase [Alkaliphilus peptidifermentans DSM 18978]
MRLPDSINLANLPTKIERLERFSENLGDINIYIKRDDQTGTEIAGNKVRKLEYAVKEALDSGCDTLITCGGIQSNHARATAAVAARLGMKAVLVLRSDETPQLEGNYFLDKLLGAKIILISSKEYATARNEIMENIRGEISKSGSKGYIIPEGASNGIGTFGYFKAMEEIKQQEEEMGIIFDGIVVAVGSGGTYGGLFLANTLYKYGKRIIGINVCDNAEYFKNKVISILEESGLYLNEPFLYQKNDIEIIDGYVGRGYALSDKKELDFIYNFSAMEGIILDPVYTGKAMYGLSQEIKKGSLIGLKNLLFIHSGGVFGLFPKRDMFEF